MKRVLVISYYWPPSGGSGVQRWVKMCKYLPSLGWQPVVYTPLNPALIATDNTLNAEVPPEVEVIRRRILEPGQFIGARKSTGAQVNPINAQKKSLKQRVAVWIRGNFFIPDPRILWVRPSVKWLLGYLKDHPVDAIISTGPPHSMHLIARGVARRTGLPWLADFRDPWTKMFYFKHLGLGKRATARHLKLEQSVLDEATRIIAVSPLVQQDFEAMTKTPVELVTNGFDETDFPVKAQESTSDKFTVSHAGLFAADGDPLCVWDAMKQLCDEVPGFSDSLRIVLAGKTDSAVLQSIRERGLGENLCDLGYVDHTRAVEVMCSASVLLLPLRREPEYRCVLPGKTFEYLASRRPIIGIGQTDSAMSTLISKAGAGVCYDWENTAAVKAELLRLWTLWHDSALSPNDADLSEYSRKGLAEKIANILSKI